MTTPATTDLGTRIADMLSETNRGKPVRWTFTLEGGRGMTYASGKPTLYGHSTYPRGSVLAGSDRRVFMEAWETWEEARPAIADLKRELKSRTGKRVTISDYGPDGGTSYSPPNLNHLPDGPDL